MRAFLSVFDKSGIVELADALHSCGVDLVSSGGTADAIASADIPVTDVADVTGFPAMLGHRVVTLHPKVHGGILADRDDPDHVQDMERHEIDPIDIVVGNLYPFESQPSTELIDIGGPTLLRSAAKNFQYVTVLVDPEDYELVLEEIRQNGNTSLATRRELARKAFAHTAAYDSAITKWFDDSVSTEELRAMPETLELSLQRAQGLRYGENPHQQGARYRQSGVATWWDSVEQLSGVDLSYLNLFDTDAAWRLVHDLGSDPTVAIIKHANPCGLSIAEDLAVAYQRAYACDPRSAFGGIVALNRVVDSETAEQIEAAAQADVIIAPGFQSGVVERLVAKRKNTRILKALPPETSELSIRPLSGGFLVQEGHRFGSQPEDWTVVTKRSPTSAERADAEVAWKVCSYVTSNAIALVKDRTAWGIGAGQQNRVEAGQLAATKAAGRAIGGACASDAFYPFRDGIDAAAEAGAAVVIQPGGSVNDAQTIEAANELDLAMIFTGERQFRH